MTCFKCKKRHVCFIIREFESTVKKTYPWWEPPFEAIYDFVYGHCPQFELMYDYDT